MFQINNLHINISWSPPEFPGGPIASYNIQINSTSKNDKNVSLVKDLDVKLLNEKVKSKSNGRPIFSYVTGPLDYATNYQVYIYATSISGVRGKLHYFFNCEQHYV